MFLAKFTRGGRHNRPFCQHKLPAQPHRQPDIVLTDEFQRSRVLSRSRRGRRDRRRPGPVRLGGAIAAGFEKLIDTRCQRLGRDTFRSWPGRRSGQRVFPDGQLAAMMIQTQMVLPREPKRAKESS